MKRVFAVAGKPVVLEVPEPELRSGEVLVAPAFSAISVGTETGIIRSTDPHRASADELFATVPRRPKLRDANVRWDGASPRPEHPGRAHLGYGLAGRVIAVSPEVIDIEPGDLVACSGDQCAFHAERVAVPRHLLAPVPDGVRLDQAAFVTLGAIVINGLRRTDCRFGETVVIYGLGLLGLIAVQVARAAGLYVIGLDINERRLAQGRALGAHLALNPQKEDATEAVHEFTDGFGADAVLMCIYSESSEPLNHAFDLCRQRARVVGIGAFGMNISRDRMYSRDVALYPSLAYGPGRYDHVYEEGNVDFPIGYVRWAENRNMAYFLRLIAEGKVNVDPLAPDRIPIADAPSAYDRVRAADRPPTVLITYDTRSSSPG